MNTLIYLTFKKDDKTVTKDKCFECTLWKEVGLLTLAISATYLLVFIAFT